MANLPIQGLPQANIHFTALKGTGPIEHNLAAKLHQHTLTSSDHLHPLKEHIDVISKAFNAPVFKRAIRQGGLSLGEQKMLKLHIFEKDKSLASNTLKKTRLKELISHYAAPGHGGLAGAGQTGQQPTKGQLAARKARMREQSNEVYESAASGSASQLGQHAVSSISQTQKSQTSVAGDKRGGFASDNAKKSIGSISQLISQPKTGPATPSHTFTPPHLAV